MVHSRPESYNTVCPRPKSCDTPRGALMSVTPNLSCDEIEPRSIHSPENLNSVKIGNSFTPLFAQCTFHCTPFNTKPV